MNNTLFMNMCMIYNQKTNEVIIQDKINSDWTGITFPGGKVENGESFASSVIREIKEETGLTVSNLQYSGIIHWHNLKNNDKWVILLYKTCDYTGELVDSTCEGKVNWVNINDIHSMELAYGFEKYLELFLNDEKLEAYATWHGDFVIY